MQQTVLAIVEDTPEVLKHRLKREWDAIEEQRQAGVIDYDVKRARALTTYLGFGLTQRQIGACVGINPGWFDQLLRYGRFMNFVLAIASTTVAHIPEGRFRRYWKETSDKQVIKEFRGNGKGKNKDDTARLAYEQGVFQQIMDKIREEEAMPPQPSIGATRKLAKQMLAQFGDGKLHRLGDMATALEADRDVVRAICDRIFMDGAYQTYGERHPAAPAQGGYAYRFVKGGKKKIDVTAFYAEVKPVLDDMENVINGHHVDFSQQAMKLAFARFRKVIERVAR